MYFQKEDVKLGQRKGLSEKDVMKLNAMYEDVCGNPDRTDQQRPPDHLHVIFKWIERTFGI